MHLVDERKYLGKFYKFKYMICIYTHITLYNM